MLTYPNRQSGSALVVAIFVIVVMALIAVALYSLFGSASSATVANVGGARANFAAKSATQEALLKLFPVGGGVADCSVTTIPAFDSEGLRNCSAEVSCAEIVVTELSATLYRLEAEGSCELGTETYTRRILTEATDAND